MKTISMVFIIFLFSAFQCDSEDKKEYIEVQLELPFKIDPPDESVILGDTLWIQVNSPDTLRDYISNKYYKLPNYDFPTRLMVLKLIDPTLAETNQPGAINKFTIYPVIGGVENIGSLSGDLRILNNIGSQNYDLRIGMIPKEKGIYSFIILLSNGVSGSPLPIVNESLANNGKSIIYYMVRFNFVMNEGNFHYNLYQSNVKTDPLMGTEPDFERIFPVYTFEVK